MKWIKWEHWLSVCLPCLSVHLFNSETICCILRYLVLQDLLNVQKFKFTNNALVQSDSYLSLRETWNETCSPKHESQWHAVLQLLFNMFSVCLFIKMPEQFIQYCRQCHICSFTGLKDTDNRQQSNTFLLIIQIALLYKCS